MGYKNPLHEKRWKWERAAGRPTGFVDATPVRERVLALNRAGFPFDAIATAANVSASTVEDTAHGRRPTVQRKIAQRIALVTPETIFAKADDTQNVPIYATRRRVEALHRMGWRTIDIDDALGRRLVQGNMYRGRWVYARTHRAIAAVYDELQMRQGPSSRTTNIAIRHGYAPPLAWDNIEDPDALPHGNEGPSVWSAEEEPCHDAEGIDIIAVHRALDGDFVSLTTLERHRAIVIGTSNGMGAGDLAARLRITERTVERHRGLHTATCASVTAEQDAA